MQLSGRIITFAGRVTTTVLNSWGWRQQLYRNLILQKSIHATCRCDFFRKRDESETRLALRDDLFKETEVKDKKAFLEIMDRFLMGNPNKKGHVEFIKAALKVMDDFGVLKDVEVYKKLLDLFPKGKMIPKNLIQAEFWHFPHHQECAILLLEQMEENGICPDREVRELVLSTFGFNSNVFKKYARMMYWMPKFKNISPYPLPNPVPKDPLELAKLAIKRISVDLQSKLTVFSSEEIKDSVDKTWIVTSQSPKQQELIEQQPVNKSMFIEGSYTIWLRDSAISYFVLRAEPMHKPRVEIDADDVSNIEVPVAEEPKEVINLPSVHEQDDGVILAMCATGTSSRDSLLSWLRFLQRTNSKLEQIPIVFTVRAPSKALVTVNQDLDRPDYEECVVLNDPESEAQTP